MDDVSHCEVLLGIKEVPVNQLVPERLYCFFSHTIKRQPHNRELLRTVLERRVTLLDYEVMTNEAGTRIIAFGRFAGIVGAHNGLMAYGNKTGAFVLPQMVKFFDYAEAKKYYAQLQLPPMRIVLTGTGRVGAGAVEVLDDMGIRRVAPVEYLNERFDEAVYTQLECTDYVKRPDGLPFTKAEFYASPGAFESNFERYTRVSDLFINGIYWDSRAPVFFTLEQMRSPGFSIRVIADITCDLMPESSVPATIRASTIAEPVFGFDPRTGTEVLPYQAHTVDMMTIDNLPNELPRDASNFFGAQFVTNVLEELLGTKDTRLVERATIARAGKLTPRFEYLKEYVSVESAV
jgi:hypothetical protein